MNSTIVLRDVIESDLPVFFDQQQDPDANYMAAFTAKDPADEAAFKAHWTRILADETTLNKTIVVGGIVAGHVSRYEEQGRQEVTYWLGREFWGRGIATRALAALLNDLPQRPLYARAAKDNVASLRVLEKCGFAIIGEDKGFSNARHTEVEEFLLKLT